MKPGEAMRAASPGKLGKAVGEVAERGSGGYGDQAECGYGNPDTCIDAVQQEHKPGNRYGWNCE